MKNIQTPDPELADLLKLHKRDIFLSMNCHAIATVQSFDSVKQTISATINYKKSYMQRNVQTKLYEKIEVDYPILLDVPVIVLRGGLAGLTMPIKKGDECLILFNDRSIDNWFQSGQVVPLSSPRLHDMSDGIALVGLSNMSNLIEDYDADNPTIYNGTTSLKVKENKILLKNSTESLNAILQDLVIAIKTLSTTPAVPGSPVALDAATILNLTNIATRIGGLLE